MEAGTAWVALLQSGSRAQSAQRHQMYWSWYCADIFFYNLNILLKLTLWEPWLKCAGITLLSGLWNRPERSVDTSILIEVSHTAGLPFPSRLAPDSDLLKREHFWSNLMSLTKNISWNHQHFSRTGNDNFRWTNSSDDVTIVPAQHPIECRLLSQPHCPQCTELGGLDTVTSELRHHPTCRFFGEILNLF